MELPEIAKTQLQQCIETYRTQLSLLVQVCTVLVVADATTVAYASQQRLASLLWIGTIFPIVMLRIIRQVFRTTVPVLATAVAIETKYKDSDIGGLVSTFISVAISFSFLERLRAAATMDDELKRTKALSALKGPHSLGGGGAIKFILLFITICQAIAPALLWRFAGWTLIHK